MNKKLLILGNAAAALVLITFSACSGSGSESIEEISIRRQCRANMNTICTEQASYCDATGEWASDMEQLDQYARRAGPLTCPVSREEYLLEQSDSGYVIICPAGHGSIDTGRRSWTGETE